VALLAGAKAAHILVSAFAVVNKEATLEGLLITIKEAQARLDETIAGVESQVSLLGLLMIEAQKAEAAYKNAQISGQAALTQFEAQLVRLRERVNQEMNKIGEGIAKLPEFVDDNLGAAIDKIKSKADSMRQELAKLVMTPAQFLAWSLRAAGASGAQIARMLKLQDMIDMIRAAREGGLAAPARVSAAAPQALVKGTAAEISFRIGAVSRAHEQREYQRRMLEHERRKEAHNQRIEQLTEDIVRVLEQDQRFDLGMY